MIKSGAFRLSTMKNYKYPTLEPTNLSLFSKNNIQNQPKETCINILILKITYQTRLINLGIKQTNPEVRTEI